jgi:hypothetical protein
LTPEERALFGLSESMQGKGNAVGTYEGLLARFLQKGRGPLVAFDEQVETGRPGSAARFTRTTLLPAGDALVEAAGKNLRLPIPPGMSAGSIAKLLEDLRRADPDHKIQLVRIDEDFVEVQIGELAEGGIVTSPTLKLVGESGPEAVIPLSRPGSVEAIRDALAKYFLGGDEQPIATTPSTASSIEASASRERSDQELLFDLVAMDRKLDLGFFKAEQAGGAAVTLGSFSAGGSGGQKPYINPALENLKPYFAGRLTNDPDWGK